ncbi:MAG: spore coat associated protein CotJA [Defluviitaleaceae bacterium]|nr:spore coat associated protein CotJA [Defluviitaleaceae bacterium]
MFCEQDIIENGAIGINITNTSGANPRQQTLEHQHANIGRLPQRSFGNNMGGNRPCIVVNSFAEAYVADQHLTELYSAIDGLAAGTIFPELNIPYQGRPTTAMAAETI